MVKRVLPPISNEVINLIKDTSLVYAIGISELLRVAKIAAVRDALFVPFIVAAVFYLVMTAVIQQFFGVGWKIAMLTVQGINFMAILYRKKRAASFRRQLLIAKMVTAVMSLKNMSVADGSEFGPSIREYCTMPVSGKGNQKAGR